MDDDQLDVNHPDDAASDAASDAGAKYEGMGCLVLCIGIALAVAGPAIVKIIEAFR